MEKLEIGDHYSISCYKHNGMIHKIWEDAVLLDIKENYIVLANANIKVRAGDGRSWKTKEPSILFFFKDNWYNITAIVKKEGIQYKCDLASPYIIEDKVIKYIDYDLDIKVFVNGAFKIVDRGEYNYHKNKMNYSRKIDEIIKVEVTDLVNDIKRKEFPFNKEDVEKYYNQYLKISVVDIQ